LLPKFSISLELIIATSNAEGQCYFEVYRVNGKGFRQSK